MKNNNNIILFCFGAALIGLLHGCEYEQKEKVEITDLPEEVSFSDHILPIFENNCIRCHDGSTPPDLTNDNAYLNLGSGNYLDTENPEESSFYQKITGSGSMSPYVDDYERALILEWIKQGAQEN